MLSQRGVTTQQPQRTAPYDSEIRKRGLIYMFEVRAIAIYLTNIFNRQTVWRMPAGCAPMMQDLVKHRYS
jgi:hypothetical protein